MTRRDKKKANRARRASAKTKAAAKAVAAKSRATPEKQRNGVVTGDGRVIECDDLLACVREQTRLADAEVRPWQAGLVPGDYFFMVGNDLPIFGEVLEVYDAMHVRHFRLARCFSTVCPNGEIGDVHVADVREKITQREFDRAQRVGWSGFICDGFADAVGEEFGIEDATAVAILLAAAAMPDSGEKSIAAIAVRCGVRAYQVSGVLNREEFVGRYIVTISDPHVRYVLRIRHDSLGWVLHGCATYADMARFVTFVYGVAGGRAVPEVYLLNVATGKAKALSGATDLDRDLWEPISVFGLTRFEMMAVFPPPLFDAVSANAAWA